MSFNMQQKITDGINKEFLSKRIIRSLMCLDKLYALIQISIFNGRIVHIVGNQ